jgi:glyoxylase-like metal-dependent hydrolase (beta-lactamase superfamily II)
MKNKLCKFAVLLCVASGAPAAVPTLDNAARALGVDAISSVEFEARGRYYQFGQAPAPELAWPAFEVDGYVATLDFARGAVHARYHRVQVQEPGRLRPASAQTMDQFARDGVTWNLTPAPTPIPTNLAERMAEIWASPQGFIKAARAHAATLRTNRAGISVSFQVGEARYDGLVNAAGEVVYVRTMMDSNVLGDTPIEWRYSNYRHFGGVNFPAHIVRRVADLPWYELEVSAVRINTAAEFAIPPSISANPVPIVTTVDVTELSPGLWFLGGTSHNSVVVEQQSGVVIIEAPLNEERSDAVLKKVRELVPAKPIVAVINTHAHFDHAGGLRTYAAAGIPIIAQARNVKFYQRAWKRPRTLNPDRLTQAGRAPKFRSFTTKLALADGKHPIEIDAIEGSGHNDAFALVYLPADKVLVEADAWTPLAAGATPPAAVNPLWTNLADNVARLKLEVERIAPLHGAIQASADFKAALGLR